MKLLVLTQNNCRYCGMVTQYLNENEIGYETINMSDHPEYIDKYNVTAAPTILLLDGEEVVAKTTGFNPDILESFIDQL